jgi:hypothetical protein
MKKLKLLLSALAFTTLACAANEGVAEPIVVQDVGFATPESVLHDTTADLYLVSNINGSPFGTDDNGFISRISPDGTVSALKWIDGASDDVTLHAPKGMGIAGGVLYVADIDHVRMFDAATGAPQGAVRVEGATFLNDIATGPDGSVFVSDSGFNDGFEPSGTDAIYEIAEGKKVSAVARGEALGNPNGLLVRGEEIVVVTFGSGEVYVVSAGTERSAGVKTEEGSLDGVIGLEDNELLVSSWGAEGVYRGPAEGPFTMVATGLPAPADIGWDAKRQRFLVPLFKTNIVQIHQLNRLE